MNFKIGDKVQWKHSVADKAYGGRVGDQVFDVLAVMDDKIRVNSGKGTNIIQNQEMFKFAKSK